MKYLTDRHEIAKAMNFGKYPVLTIDRENCPLAEIRPNSTFATGCRVRVAWDHKDPRYEGMTTHGELQFSDGKLQISGEGGCLHTDFGYYDVMKMVREANAPIVHAGQTVVVVEEWSSKKTCTVRLMKVGRLNMHCQTAAVLHDIDKEDGAE